MKISLISLGSSRISPFPNIRIEDGSNFWRTVAKKANSSKLNLYAYRAFHYALVPRLIADYCKEARIVHEEMSPLPVFSPLYLKNRPAFLTVNELRGIASIKILGPLGVVELLAEKFLSHCRYDEVISASEWTHDRLLELGVTSVLIPNGTDTRKFRPSEYTARESVVIATVGRLVSHKGHEDFLRLAYKLRKNKGLSFVIVGVGPEEHRLRLLAKRLGLDSVVSFRGNLSELDYTALLRDIDIYVHANRFQEGFGFSIAEAMSCGKPVVGFDVPGVRELIQNGVSGFLVPPGDLNLMSETVFRLSQDVDFRLRLGKAAREFVERNCDWARSSQLLSDLYDRYS